MITTREAMFMEAIDRIAGTLDELAEMARGGNSKPPVERIAQTVYGAREYVREVRRVEGMPDNMAAGWNRPAPASLDTVVGILEDAAQRVAIGDSFEGTITWVMPTDEPELEGFDFGVIARYRIGNLDGQGGLRVYSVPTTPKDDAGT